MKLKSARPLARLSFALVASLATMLPIFSALATNEASAQIVTNADRCTEDLSSGQRRYIERVLKARLQCETKVILGALPANTNCLTGRGDTMCDKRLRRAEDQLSNVGGDCSGVN